MEVSMTAGIFTKIIRIPMAFCLAALCIAGAEAQEIEYVGSYYLGGEFAGLHVNFPYAFCGMNRGFQILDVSYPEAIIRVGDNPFVGQVRGFSVSGAYAYATTFGQDFGRFFIVDIEDVEAPAITAVLDSVGRGQLAISDDYAYILDYDEPVGIIDVSDPYNPEIAGTYVNNDNNYDIFISGSYAYLASDDVGLRVLDISDPLEPVVIGQYSSPVSVCSGEVFVSGTYAYTVSRTSDYDAMIEIVDVSDPYEPVYVGHLDVWNAGGLFVEGNYVYAFQEWFFDAMLLIIVNVEDPANPYIESSTEFGSILDPLNIFVAEGRAYVSRDQTLTIMDVSDPSAPTELGGYTSKSGLDRIEVEGNYVYGIFGPLDGDLYIFGISDPSSPELVAAYYVGGVTSDLTVTGDYVYVAANGLKIVDVSIPESPLLVGEYETGTIRSVDVQGDYAYLSVWASEMHVVNIADTGNPVLVGQCPVEWPWGIFVQDDLAFIARYYDDLGLAIVDISNPQEPIFIGGCEAPVAYQRWVHVQSQYAYMTVNDGIQIIDVSDPYNPDPVAYYYTPGRTDDVYIRENHAYIADAQNGLIILDISNPPNPEFVASFDTPGWAHSVQVLGEYAYVADEYSLMILGFTPGPCEYIAGDCNHNGIALELGDVAAMIGNYRGTIGPYYICDCGVDPPGSHFAATADPDGNCVPNELSDVVSEIGAYRGTAEVSGCPDCPGSGR